MLSRARDIEGVRRGGRFGTQSAATLYDTGGSIDVALFEREQLRGGEAGSRPRARPSGTPCLAGLSSISFQATARFSTCRSAWVASKRCPSGTVGRHAQTCSGESSARRTSPRPAVAFPSTQLSFATVTSFRPVLLDPLAERQIRRTATGQDRPSLIWSALCALALLLNPPTCSLAEPRLRRDSGRPATAPRPRSSPAA